VRRVSTVDCACQLLLGRVSVGVAAVLLLVSCHFWDVERSIPTGGASTPTGDIPNKINLFSDAPSIVAAAAAAAAAVAALRCFYLPQKHLWEANEQIISLWQRAVAASVTAIATAIVAMHCFPKWSQLRGAQGPRDPRQCSNHCRR